MENLLKVSTLFQLDSLAHGRTTIIKSCFEPRNQLLTILLSNNTFIFVLLGNQNNCDNIKLFVPPLNFKVIDFDLSSSGKYTLCLAEDSDLFICPGQSLFASVQASGPWTTDGVTVIEYLDKEYVEPDFGSVLSLDRSGSSGSFTSPVAVGWLYIRKRDVGVVVQRQGVLIFIDLRDEIVVSKITIGKDPLVAALFIKHENRVLVKNVKKRWFGTQLREEFGKSLSRIVSHGGSSSSGSSAGSNSNSSNSLKNNNNERHSQLNKNRKKGKSVPHPHLQKKPSHLATGPPPRSPNPVQSPLIALAYQYYAQFDDCELQQTEISSLGESKMIAARKRHDEVLIFSTVLDPNFCFQYSFRNLTPQFDSQLNGQISSPLSSLSPSSSSTFEMTLSSTDATNSESLTVVHNVILQGPIACVQQEMRNVRSGPLPSASHSSTSSSSRRSLGLHLLNFVASGGKNSLVHQMPNLKEGEVLMAVHQIDNYESQSISVSKTFTCRRSSSNAQKRNSIDSFLVVTNYSAFIVWENVSPEKIALDYGAQKRLSEALDFCIALKLNVKSICTQLAAKMLEKADYEYALELFVTAQTNITEQVDVFYEHHALEICFDHFRNKFLKKEFPDQEVKSFTEKMIHAYIQQIHSSSSVDAAAQYTSELGQILRDSFDYSEEKAMKHLLESGLLMFYFQVATQRGLVPLSFNLLLDNLKQAVSRHAVSAVIQNGLVEDYLTFKSGIFLDKLQMSLLLEALGNNCKLAINIREHVMAGINQQNLNYHEFFRVASLFDPSKRETVLAIKEIAREKTLSGPGLDWAVYSLSAINSTVMDASKEKETQTEIMMDVVAIFINSLLHMKIKKEKLSDSGSGKMREEAVRTLFKPEYLNQTQTALDTHISESSTGTYPKKRRNSRSASLDFTSVQKPIRKLIGASSDHVGVISPGGRLYMMGSTSNGKLGVGDLAMSTEFHKPLCVELLHIFGVKVKTLSCGAEHTLCLTSNGVYSWGSNKYGQLGIGEGVPFSSKPIAVSQFILEKPVHIACGDYHSMVYTRNPRKLYSFGWGVYGQLGQGSSSNSFLPVETLIPPSTTVISINAGKTHSTLLTDQGQVYAWGSNKLGQLGIFDLKTQKSTEPVLVKFFKESVTVLRTRGFENIICSSSGRIIKFGCDPNKMQSYITRVKKSRANATSRPETLYSEEYFKVPREIGIGTDVLEDRVLDFDIGSSHILCLLQSGLVWGCGRNESCQLALSSSNIVNEAFFPLTTVPTANHIATLRETSIIVGSDSRCYIWGKVHSSVVEKKKEYQHLSQETSLAVGGDGDLHIVSEPTCIKEIPNDDKSLLGGAGSGGGGNSSDMDAKTTLSNEIKKKKEQLLFPENNSETDEGSSILTSSTSLDLQGPSVPYPLTRLENLPRFESIQESDQWKYGMNTIFRSIELLKSHYRFYQILRIGIQLDFWAFCRNLCALHGYYLMAFQYDLKDLGGFKAKREAMRSLEVPQPEITGGEAEEGVVCGAVDEVFLADFYQSFETALLNVTELGREDRSEAWLGIIRSGIQFIQTHTLSTQHFQKNLQSYINTLEFEGAFHSVLFQLLVSDSREGEWMCEVLSPSFVLNTIETTFTLRPQDVALYLGQQPTKSWSKAKTDELTKFIRELSEDEELNCRVLREKMRASVGIPSNRLLAMSREGKNKVAIFSCGHVSDNVQDHICHSCY